MLNAILLFVFLGEDSSAYLIKEWVMNTPIIRSDISRRKKIENELKCAKESAEAASAAKSAFLANMTASSRHRKLALLARNPTEQQMRFSEPAM